MSADLIPIDECRRLFRYEPDTGKIYRLTMHGRFLPETECGYRKWDYSYVGYGNKYILFHRLAWALHYGEWPKLTIDHINLDRHDNRICNLREASMTENIWNRAISKSNTSGFKGVARNKRTGRYRAKIVANKVRYDLGEYNTPEEASAAYCRKAAELHGRFYHPEKDSNHA